MRNTLKPYKRNDSRALNLRRKTVIGDVKENILIDEDNLENIDDYWTAAKTKLEEIKIEKNKKNASFESIENVDEKDLEEVENLKTKNEYFNEIRSIENKTMLDLVESSKRKRLNETKIADISSKKTSFDKDTKKNVKKNEIKGSQEYDTKYNAASIKKSKRNDQEENIENKNSNNIQLNKNIEDCLDQLNVKEDKFQKPVNIITDVFNNNIRDELNTANISGISDTVVPFEKENDHQSMVFFDDHGDFEQEEIISNEDKNDNTDEISDDGNENISDKENLNDNSKNHKQKNFKKKSVRMDFNSMKIIENKNDVSYRQEKKKSGISSGKNHVKNINDLYYVPNLSFLCRDKNEFSFLIGSKDIETSLLSLKQNAFVEKTNADKSFSILVLRGKIVITIENTEIELAKNGMFVVGKDKKYQIKCISKLANIFVSYSLK